MVQADLTSHTPVTSSFGCRCCAGSQSFQGSAATNHFRGRLLEIQVIFLFFFSFFAVDDMYLFETEAKFVPSC